MIRNIRNADTSMNTSDYGKTARNRARSQRFARTKTGCFTCRGRRKKCDETRDAVTGGCLRCRNAGIKCLGFPSTRRPPAVARQRQLESQSSTVSIDDNAESPSVTSRNTNADGEASLIDKAGVCSPIAELEILSNVLSSEDVDFANTHATCDDAAHQRPLDQQLPTTTPLDVSTTNTSHNGTPCHDYKRPTGQLDFDWLSYSTLQSPNDASPLNMPNPALSNPAIHILDNPLEQFKTLAVHSEEQTFDVLASLYGTFSWYWCQSSFRSKNRRAIIKTVRNQLERSPFVRMTVTAVAACYYFGRPITLPRDNASYNFEINWQSIYANIVSFESNLGSKSTPQPFNVVERPYQVGHTPRNTFATVIGSKNPSSSLPPEVETLYESASQMLRQIVSIVRHDHLFQEEQAQEPLDQEAIAQVDEYLHGAMDLALYSYACKSAQRYLEEFDTATSLMEGLLGRARSVHLPSVACIELVGFSMYVWADIMQAITRNRSTQLHYLMDNDIPAFPCTRNFGQTQGSRSEQHFEDINANCVVLHTKTGGPDVAPMMNNIEETQDNDEETKEEQENHVKFLFGCSTDVLSIIASIANLSFQISQARTTGSISGNGPQVLPAWALHTANDIKKRIDASLLSSVEVANDKSTPEALANMWRHAAIIYLNTAVFRIGPLSKSNQIPLQNILEIWNKQPFNNITVACGNPATPMLFASFVAIHPDDRATCLNALRSCGQDEAGRDGYRSFVEDLWRMSDETGFTFLWPDLVAQTKTNLVLI